ncbi:MAG: F0F1 ATP synthase subunit delta [Alphaproteobacteria bacterium]|nr:F0F1 ATP synthase subunit delta [Alphaproteobacteria bacterium]
MWPWRLQHHKGSAKPAPISHAATALHFWHRAKAQGAVQPDGRVDVSEPASISSGIAARYATAIFELSKEAKALKALEKDVDALKDALADSAELRNLISSPVYSRDDVARAIGSVAAKMDLSKPVAGGLGLMASKRRMFALPQVLAALRGMIADEKGEITAEVASAQPLSKAQEKELMSTLKARVGKDIKLETSVDETLIGGLVIKVGSQMIDTSIRAQLAALKNSMKEVG